MSALNICQTRKRVWSVLACGLMLASGGCQTYEHKPLGLSSYREAFVARTPESPEVSEFARRLGISGSGHEGGFAVGDGVSMREAEVIALVFNADLRTERLKTGVTKASVENAGRWEDPSIGVDIARIIESVQHPWKVAGAVGLTLPISGRQEIEQQRAGFEHAAALSRVVQHEWRVRMEVRRVWMRWESFEAQVGTTREFLERVEQVLSVVDAMEAAGEMTRTEARLFRIEKATKKAELSTLDSQLEQAALSLRQLMGLSAGAPITLVHAGLGGVPMPEIDLASLESRSPHLQVAAAEYEAAEKALELAVRKQYPDLNISPGYGNEDGDNEVLLGLSLPLPILNGNRREIAEARAEREVARASAEAALERLLGDVEAAESRRRSITLQREVLETEIVPLVDAQYADARQVAQLGEVNALVLLESLSRQQEAKMRLIESRREEWLAVIDLIDLLGPETTERTMP